MKQTLKTLCIAALAVVGAMTTGCTSLEIPEKTRNEEEKTVIPGPSANSVTLITTIALGGNPESKALSAAGVKTFAAGEQVAVIYEDENGDTQKAVSTALEAEDIHDEGKKADITVTLTDPAQNGTLRYIYPAAMAKATIATDATIDDAGTIDFTNLDAQDGTLATLSGSLDLAVYDGNLTGEATLPASVTLTNQLTIGEFTIKNADGSLNITGTIARLTVSDGTYTYTVKPEAPATNFGDGPIYVAMKPVTDDKTLTFTIDNNATPKEVTGKAFDAGKMYPVGLKFGSSVALSGVTTTDGNGALYYAAQNGDILSGYFSEAYVTVADGATVTLNKVHIYNPINCDHAILHCLGDATIVLADGSYNALVVPGSNNPAVFVPQGKTLTISGTGELYADSEHGGAGIGGGSIDNSTPINCGTIVIAGGVIEAEGGYGAAGIGSGYCSSCDGIIICGGVITSARGGQNSAGIGCGYIGTCGDIEISGGQIGGDYGGRSYNGAVGGESAAGIGCGYSGTCGDITIGAGITYIRAQKGNNAGNSVNCIGKSIWGSCGTVTIDASLTVEEIQKYAFIYPTAP